MRRGGWLAAVAAAAALVALAGAQGAAWALHDPQKFADPALAGGTGGIYFTGAPRQKQYTCAACHLPTAGQIRADIASAPADLAAGAYQPGETYLVTVTLLGEHLGTASLANINAFEAEVDDDAGAVAGTLDLSDPAATQLLDDGRVVADAALDRQDTWTFQWTAPAAGAGPLSLYLVMVDGNGAEDPGAESYDVVGDDLLATSIRLCEGAGGCPALPSRGAERSPAGCTFAPGPGQTGLGTGILALGLALAVRRRRRRPATQ